jgi:hypothetical protein
VSEIRSMSQDLESLGIISPAVDGARVDLWEFLYHPHVTTELRQARAQEIKILQTRFLGRRVFKKTEANGSRGTVLYVRPASGKTRMYSRGVVHSGYEVYVKFAKGRGVYISTNMIEVEESGR